MNVTETNMRVFYPKQVCGEKRDIDSHFEALLQQCITDLRSVANLTEEKLIASAKKWLLIRRHTKIIADNERLLLQKIRSILDSDNAMIEVEKLQITTAKCIYTGIFTPFERRDRQQFFEFFKKS